MADDRQAGHLTRLSLIHPYPAMIPDALATEIVNQYVMSTTRLLDPFCGTSRTVIAGATKASKAMGLDVNPLAILISRAKIAHVRAGQLEIVLKGSTCFRGAAVENLDMEPGRAVKWFSRLARRELTEIVHWLNRTELSPGVLAICGVILSATVREVSYCRKQQWKLHRMSAEKRHHHRLSPWSVFDRRAKRVIAELQSAPSLVGQVGVMCGDAGRLTSYRQINCEAPFNMVFSSPPYGDSRTTVGYGDVSALCLGVLQHVRKLGLKYIAPAVLDDSCLGGERYARSPLVDVHDYWLGSRDNPGRNRVQFFLDDLRAACAEMNSVLEKKARMVFVVARRNVGGRRVYIDDFLGDVLCSFGFRLKLRRIRRIVGKNTPFTIDARGAGGTSLIRRTMKEEFVLVFERGAC